MLGRALNLYEQRANLGIYGKAYLLMVLQALKLPQGQPLQTELTGAAILSASGTHWEEAKQDLWTMNSNLRSTAIVVMALSRANKGGTLPPLLGDRSQPCCFLTTAVWQSTGPPWAPAGYNTR